MFFSYYVSKTLCYHGIIHPQIYKKVFKYNLINIRARLIKKKKKSSKRKIKNKKLYYSTTASYNEKLKYFLKIVFYLIYF